MPLPDLSLAELVSEGFLQEANRRFFHPLGLGLCVHLDKGELTHLSMLDNRDEPGGIIFEDGVMDRDKTDRVNAQWFRNQSTRGAEFGYVIQPPPEYP